MLSLLLWVLSLQHQRRHLRLLQKLELERALVVEVVVEVALDVELVVKLDVKLEQALAAEVVV